ncbi:MAG: hypothetical protein H7X79_01665 [Sporomusaceae bacterium]|nr:hypothetical protein [Sporomusaceae bacterium]
MINQDEPSGRPLDISKIQWALRHGQKIDGLEEIIQSSQPVVLPDNQMDNSMTRSSAVNSDSLHTAALEEQSDKPGQSLNREIVSLKGEFAIETQGTALEEKIDQLDQSLNQEILALKSELANVAQGTAVEEQIDQLGQSLNLEILSLKSELAIMAQDRGVKEKIDQLGQSLSQEIVSLKTEFGVIAQGAAFETQVIKLGKYINQEFVALKSEVGMFVQNQLNQEKVRKQAEIEWKKSLEDRENQLQSDIRQMQHSILGNFEEKIQYVNEQLQNNDTMLRQEVSLLTSQLAALQQSQTSEGEVLIAQWREKMEEGQKQLLENVGYIQYVAEEIATRPHSTEAQQKLRENFFIREIAALKEEMKSICKKCKSLEKGCMLADAQQEIDLGSEDQTKIYKRKRKRR